MKSTFCTSTSTDDRKTVRQVHQVVKTFTKEAQVLVHFFHSKNTIFNISNDLQTWRIGELSHHLQGTTCAGSRGQENSAKTSGDETTSPKETYWFPSSEHRCGKPMVCRSFSKLFRCFSPGYINSWHHLRWVNLFLHLVFPAFFLLRASLFSGTCHSSIGRCVLSPKRPSKSLKTPLPARRSFELLALIVTLR